MITCNTFSFAEPLENSFAGTSTGYENKNIITDADLSKFSAAIEFKNPTFLRRFCLEYLELLFDEYNEIRMSHKDHMTEVFTLLFLQYSVADPGFPLGVGGNLLLDFFPKTA